MKAEAFLKEQKVLRIKKKNLKLEINGIEKKWVRLWWGMLVMGWLGMYEYRVHWEISVPSVQLCHEPKTAVKKKVYKKKLRREWQGQAVTFSFS